MAEAEAAEERICRFCFEGEDAGELISPCRCSGGQKYVHLACLRMWQRAVLGSQETHPDFYDIDTRQRVCNVCKEEFSCPPPTRAELLASFTGSEIAALIEKGSLIGSTEGFSNELEQQLAMFPETVRSGVVCRHWIRGVFLIVKVVSAAAEEVMLRVVDRDSCHAMIERLGQSGRSLHLRGRRYRILPRGPVSMLGENASGEAWREALRTMETPTMLYLSPECADDCGEDAIVAVNLTQSFDIAEHRGRRSVQRATFCLAMQRALTSLGGPLSAEVVHLVGGPCEEDEVAACMVVAGGKYRLTQGPDCLWQGLKLAAVTAKRNRGGGPAASPEPSLESAEIRRKRGRRTVADFVRLAGLKRHRLRLWAASLASRRRRPCASGASSNGGDGAGAAAADAGEAAGGASASGEVGDGSQQEESVRLFVFWGYAGWSRCQLMGEIARGSWGLCRARTADVVSQCREELYEAVYPRMMMAPKNDMSENYGGEGPELVRRREMRRMSIFHHLLQRQRAMLLADSDDSEDDDESAMEL